MTARVLTALHYRAALPLVALEDLPRVVARHVRLVRSLTARELHAYIRRVGAWS